MPAWLRRTVHGASLILGVTFISFLLMVYFGPDQTYTLLGKNTTQEHIQELRQQLGYDQPMLLRYGRFLKQLVTLDLGRSSSTQEQVTDILQRTIPVSLLLMLPGFLLGNLLGVLIGMAAATRQNRWLDRMVTAGSVVGMSLSFLALIILLQVALCTPYGVNWFPVRGWEVNDLSSWFRYATVPSLALILITLGYNTRFCRSVFVAELNREHILTARAYGASKHQLMWRHVLRNSLLPLFTRVLFSIPLVVISGSLLLETYFGIPGLGSETYSAISNGDQPVLLAVVSFSALAFVLLQLLAEWLYPRMDPRLS